MSDEQKAPEFSAWTHESFNAARAEILKHMELRDRMLVTSFTVNTGILGGTMLSKDPMIGLLVPVFGFGAAMVVCQHTDAIHAICCWTRRAIPFPHFGRSRELRNLHRKCLVSRAAAQAAILIAPALVALTYAYSAAFRQVSVELSGLWWCGVALVLGMSAHQFKTVCRVVRLNRETGYENAIVLAQRRSRKTQEATLVKTETQASLP